MKGERNWRKERRKWRREEKRRNREVNDFFIFIFLFLSQTDVRHHFALRQRGLKEGGRERGQVKREVGGKERREEGADERKEGRRERGTSRGKEERQDKEGGFRKEERGRLKKKAGKGEEVVLLRHSIYLGQTTSLFFFQSLPVNNYNEFVMIKFAYG